MAEKRGVGRAADQIRLLAAWFSASLIDQSEWSARTFRTCGLGRNPKKGEQSRIAAEDLLTPVVLWGAATGKERGYSKHNLNSTGYCNAHTRLFCVLCSQAIFPGGRITKRAKGSLGGWFGSGRTRGQWSM